MTPPTDKLKEARQLLDAAAHRMMRADNARCQGNERLARHHQRVAVFAAEEGMTLLAEWAHETAEVSKWED